MIEAALILALAVIACLYLLGRRAPGVSKAALPIRARRLLSPTEIHAWSLLRRAAPDHVVLAKVAASALLQPTAGLDRSVHFSTRGLFSGKIIDFAVCSTSGEVIALIEVDADERRAAKMARTRALLSAGGYQVVSLRSKPLLDQAAVNAALLPALQQRLQERAA